MLQYFSLLPTAKYNGSKDGMHGFHHILAIKKTIIKPVHCSVTEYLRNSKNYTEEQLSLQKTAKCERLKFCMKVLLTMSTSTS